MSDGLQHVAGAGMRVALDGRDYRLGPLSLGALAELERHVVSLRGDTMAVLAEAIDRFRPEQQQFLMSEALKQLGRQRRYASQAEVDSFLNTCDGMAFCFWLAIRPQHPEIDTPEKAGTLLAGLSPAAIVELQQKLIEASGLAALGTLGKNPSGPAPRTRPTRSPGHASTSS
jgi:hypothetical protein